MAHQVSPHLSQPGTAFPQIFFPSYQKTERMVLAPNDNICYRMTIFLVSLAPRRGNAQNQHQPRHAQQAAAGAGRVSAQPVCRAGQPVGRGRRAGRVPAFAAQSRLTGTLKTLLTFPRPADTFFIVGIIWTSAPMRSSQPNRTTLLREEGSNPCTSASLIPTDGSSYSETAIPQGLELAKKLALPVVFLYVLDETVSPIITSTGVPISQEFVDQFEERVQQLGREALERAQALAKAAGITAESKLAEGNPAPAILAEATARRPDCDGHPRAQQPGGICTRLRHHAGAARGSMPGVGCSFPSPPYVIALSSRTQAAPASRELEAGAAACAPPHCKERKSSEHGS